MVARDGEDGPVVILKWRVELIVIIFVLGEEKNDVAQMKEEGRGAYTAAADISHHHVGYRVYSLRSLLFGGAGVADGVESDGPSSLDGFYAGLLQNVLQLHARRVDPRLWDWLETILILAEIRRVIVSRAGVINAKGSPREAAAIFADQLNLYGIVRSCIGFRGNGARILRNNDLTLLVVGKPHGPLPRAGTQHLAVGVLVEIVSADDAAGF